MSERALKLIAENKKTRTNFLDLGNCGLAEVPEEIAELLWLEGLSFSSEWKEEGGEKWREIKSHNTGSANNITLIPKTFSQLKNLKKLWLRGDLSNKFNLVDLSPLEELCELQTLDLRYTRVSDLTQLGRLKRMRSLDVSHTHVSDLTPLKGLSELRMLSVSYLHVSDLTPLKELSKLQTLDLRYMQVSDLTPLCGLKEMQSLDISHTQVSDLTQLNGLSGLRMLDASHTYVFDLTPLKELNRLQTLDLRHTRVSDLTPLKELSGLKELNISQTQVSDLISLSELIGLRKLRILGTRVLDLTPLVGLTGLQTIDISHSDVSDLAPLSGLTGLQSLDISYTHVSDLAPLLPLIQTGVPVEVSLKKFLVSGGIEIEGCNITNPPAEIVKQGNAAILNYFQEKQEQGVDHLYEAKLLLVGEGGAGKTSLLRRLYQTDKPLPEENETTKGIAIHQHKFLLPNGRSFRLNVWDFGGQEIYHATHQFFLTKRSLYVLLDDTRKDHKTVHDDGFKYWLEAVDLLSGHSPVLIFQNEKGGRSKTIDLAGIKGKFDNVKECYQGNLEQADAAGKLRDALEFFAINLPHIGEELPAQWIAIRADIEQQAQRKPTISQQEYFDIYRKHLAFDRAKALHLSRYLHDLGVFLHFQDDKLLVRTIILQNSWATEAVFKMLDDEAVKGRFGRFAVTDCERLWQDSEYADMHPELLALMQKFELCYPLPDIRPDTWLAPQLLQPSKPAALKDWERPGDLVLRYCYEFLPKGMVSRLMVRQHRFVSLPELGWVTGVLFEHEGTQVLVEVPPKGGEIVLRARGSERKELLSVISADLDALNETFQGLRDKVNKWVPCHCGRCRKRAEPEFFEQKRLLQRRKDGKLMVECPASYKDVDVLELLDGIQVKWLPSWAKVEDIHEAIALEFPHKREHKKFVESVHTGGKSSFMGLASNERATLAVVFTDVVGSTALGEELKDAGMNEVRQAHFTQSRKLITQYKGREIKTIGDSFMAAFHSVENALDYAMALKADSGHTQVQIRAGIHIGPMQVEEGDVFGGEVNFAARVVSEIKDAEIWLSDEAKKHMDKYRAKHHEQLKWQQHDGIKMKGFSGTFTLWALIK